MRPFTKRVHAKRSAIAVGRTGAVYVTVLLVSLLVATLAMAAVSTTLYSSQAASRRGEYSQMQVGIHNALEWAVANINQQADWRTAHTNNVDTSSDEVDGFIYRYRIIDEDGDLADDSEDLAEIVVSVQAGYAQAAVRGLLEPAGEGLNCLQYAMVAEEEISQQWYGSWNSDHTIAAGSRVSAQGDSISGRVYSPIISGNVYGTQLPLPAPLEIPGGQLLEYYQRIGTEIPISAIPGLLGARTLSNAILSRTTNSITGVVNRNGVYVLDCGGDTITIQDCRFECTLVLIGHRSVADVGPRINWIAPQSNLPALLVDGRLRLKFDDLELAESSTNFNPPVFPYRELWNTTKTDRYPPAFHGAVYCTGDINLGSSSVDSRMHGTLIASSFTGGSDFDIAYDSRILENPPLGFRKFNKVRVSTGSLHRVAVP